MIILLIILIVISWTFLYRSQRRLKEEINKVKQNIGSEENDIYNDVDENENNRINTVEYNTINYNELDTSEMCDKVNLTPYYTKILRSDAVPPEHYMHMKPIRVLQSNL